MRLVIEQTWAGEEVGPDERVVVGLTLDDDGLWVDVDAPWHGDPAPDGTEGPTPALWEHEVVEVFVVGDSSPVRYTEIEIGPWGHHLVLQLEGVRRAVALLLPLDLAVERDRGRWRARARLDRALLPPPPHRVNAFAIHGVALRRYLAWAPLPGPRPDFHQPERFPAVDLALGQVVHPPDAE